MELFVATEARFHVSNGKITAESGTQNLEFWNRYLDVFDKVTVVARFNDNVFTNNETQIGPNVSLAPLPDYTGPSQYLRKARAITKRLECLCSGQNSFIARVPGNIGTLLTARLQRLNWPYGVEVVGDPYDVFSPKASRCPLGVLFRHVFSRDLRRICMRAVAASYVTEMALQLRYPAQEAAFKTHYSSVQLDNIAYVSAARVYHTVPLDVHLVAIGRFTHLYKGADTALESLLLLHRRGILAHLTWIGGGRYQSQMERMARELGIEGHVEFLGDVQPGNDVRKILDRADLFVMPSRQEGLPRAMIEAMARALPCIGSQIGGIPELLPPNCLFPPDNSIAMADRVIEMLSQPALMTKMSKRNLAKAAEYHENTLQHRRVQFLKYLRDVTKEFHSSRMKENKKL
ncbi:MAG: glycosyltransferase family 4 protein [Anaerolineae bacterium]|nr:glycosyltransferase family 4 protein [Anaerolineae bacterium]